MNASASGYDLSTGRLVTPPPIPPNLQRVVPGHVGTAYKPTTQDQVDHYLSIASYYTKVGTPQALQQAQRYTDLANAAAQGFYRIQSGQEQTTRGSLNTAEAGYYSQRNQTMLASVSMRDRAQIELEAQRLAGQIQVHNIDNASRSQIATRAAIYRLQGLNEQDATRRAIAEWTQENANQRSALTHGDPPLAFPPVPPDPNGGAVPPVPPVPHVNPPSVNGATGDPVQAVVNYARSNHLTAAQLAEYLQQRVTKKVFTPAQAAKILSIYHPSP
jgi:hypothetical protein